MRIIDIIDKLQRDGRQSFSFELLPPLKGDGTAQTFQAIDNLADLGPVSIDVTCHRELSKQKTLADGSTVRYSARRRPGTVGISAAIKARYNVEVVPHIICGGNSRYDIEDALIDLDFLGLNNVLALRGDKSKDEPSFTPHPQGPRNALELVKQIQAMNRGEFQDGEVEVCHHSKFSIGVAGYPEKHFEAESLDEDIMHLKRKVDAGADYILTQLFFENERFFTFVDKCRKAGITVPIIPGIKPLSTLRQLDVLPSVFACHMPQDLVQEVLKHASEKDAVREIGSEWCVKQSLELKQAGYPILHYYTVGKTDEMRKILKQVF